MTAASPAVIALKSRISVYLIQNPGNHTRKDIARALKLTVNTVAPVLDALHTAGDVSRSELQLTSGRTGFVYRYEGVKRFVDSLGRIFFTAPCPNCGQRRRLLKNRERYYLLHCEAEAIQVMK